MPQESNVEPFELDAGATRMWLEYGFPGNVRELRNIVIRLSTKHPGKSVTMEQLLNELDWEDTDSAPPSTSPEPTASADAARQRLQQDKNFQLDQLLKELERSYVEAALELTHGNLSKAARMLGLGAAAMELAEAGIIGIEARHGERVGRVRLGVGDDEVRLALGDDHQVKGLGLGT